MPTFLTKIRHSNRNPPVAPRRCGKSLTRAPQPICPGANLESTRAPFVLPRAGGTPRPKCPRRGVCRFAQAPGPWAGTKREQRTNQERSRSGHHSFRRGLGSWNVPGTGRQGRQEARGARVGRGPVSPTGPHPHHAPAGLPAPRAESPYALCGLARPARPCPREPHGYWRPVAPSLESFQDVRPWHGTCMGGSAPGTLESFWPDHKRVIARPEAKSPLDWRPKTRKMACESAQMWQFDAERAGMTHFPGQTGVPRAALNRGG